MKKWHLHPKAVWKQVQEGSRIYLPDECRVIDLDHENTKKLELLGKDGMLDELLTPTIFSLIQEGIVRCGDEEQGQTLVPCKVRPNLDYVVLRLTNACNLRCRHCFVSSGKPEPDELSLSEIEQLFCAFDEFSPLVVVLTGGEPLLRPDLFEIAEMAAKHRMAVDLSTNGLLLTPERLERLASLSNLRYVILSLEGASAEIHDYVRGEGSFNATLALMDRLAKSGLTFSVNHCVSAFNLHSLSDTIDLALEKGAASVHVAMVSESGRARAHWSEFALTEEQRLQASLVVLRKFLQTGKVFAGEAEREVIAFENVGQRMAPNCGVGRDWCMIYSNGDVAPCRPVYAAVGAAGNIRQTSFGKIWRDSPLLNLLRNIRVEEISQCRSCRWISHCRGGCRARAFMTFGDWKAPQKMSYCRHYQVLLMEVQRVYEQSF